MWMSEDKRIYFRISSLFFTELEMTNVAAFKPVTMSSESNPPAHSPHYAVDDKVVKTIWAQECVHTKGELTPWVIIDLEATFDVEYVTLFNRIDEHGKKGTHSSNIPHTHACAHASTTFCDLSLNNCFVATNICNHSV